MLFSFFLDFLSFFTFDYTKADTVGYWTARIITGISLNLLILVIGYKSENITMMSAGLAVFIAFGCLEADLLVEGKTSIYSIVGFIILLCFVLTPPSKTIVTAPDAVNAYSKVEEFPSFYETLLNKEELVRYWNARNKGLNVAEEISQDFLTQQAPFRDFFLKNPQVCFVGVPEPSMMAFEPTRGLTRFIWSVPQAWYHERKHTCRIGLVVSHGDNDHVRFLASEKAIKGYSSDRWYSSEDVQKAYPNLDLLFVSCRGDRKPFYDDAIILEHSTGAWWSTEKGRSTHADWLWWVYNNGLLTKLVDMYSY